MIVKLPVYTTQGWIIETFKVFDSCLYCGWIRKKTFQAYYNIKGVKERSWRCSCGCNDPMTDIEIVMEEMLITELESRGLLCNEIT